MRRISLLLAILTACAAMGCSRALDSNRAQWQKLETDAIEKVRGGEYPEAEKQFELAIAKAEQIPDQEPLVNTLLELSDLHIKTRQPEKCRHLLTRAHEIGEKQLRDPKLADSEFWQLSTARSAHSLANSYRDLGDFPQAEAFYNRANRYVQGRTTYGCRQLAAQIQNDHRQMENARWTGDTQIDEMLQSGRQAGDDARMKSNHEFNKLLKKSENVEDTNSPEAETILLKVLARAKSTYGIRETKYRWTLQRLFTYYSRNHQYEKARLLFEEDLKQLDPVENISREKLESDPEFLADLHLLSDTLLKLSDVAMTQNRVRDAHDYTKRVVLLRQKWGPLDLQYVHMLQTSSSQLIQLKGANAAADELDKAFRALDDIEHKGNRTLQTEDTRFHLCLIEAQLESVQGSIKQAKKHLDALRNSFPRLFVHAPILLVHALLESARLAHETKDRNDEKKFLSELDRVLIQHPTKDPHLLYSVYKQRGLYAIAVSNFSDAEGEFSRALDAAQRSESNNSIIDAYRWYAEALRSLERFPESQNYVLMALKRSESVKNWPAAIDAALCMGNYKASYGQTVEAEPYYKKALAWCEERFPDSTNPRWTALSSYNDYLRKIGKSDLAFDTMQTGLKLAQKNKADRPDLVAQAYINLGCLCNDVGKFAEARKYFEKAKATYSKESIIDHSLLFQLYSDWATSYWLERNDEKANPLFARAIEEFRATGATPTDLVLCFDSDTAFRHKLHLLRSDKELTTQRLLKDAQLLSTVPMKGYLSASSIKFLALLCTMTNRVADARTIDKFACQTRDMQK